MQQIPILLDAPTTNCLAVSQVDAQRAAASYVATHLDPTFGVVDSSRYFSEPLRREIWRFLVRSVYGPVDAVQVDAQTGEVCRLTASDIHLLREETTIL